MSEPIFTGVATALVTPFKNGGIDFEAFSKHINWQIDSGIDALVVCGTTGESPTLNDEEHKAAIEFVVKEVAGRVPVIAGTGSNDTAYSEQLTKHACDAGVDACLLITPYYNKTTQAGLIASFRKIADASTKPIILYNVPSRTGVNIASETYAELVKHPLINGIKEANGNISSVVKTSSLIGDDAYIYSGNDDQITPIISLGGQGVISVLSNIAPKATLDIAHSALSGDFKTSAKLQAEYVDLCDALFSEVNPIPVKHAMSSLGFCDNSLRLPLLQMSTDKAEVLENCMKRHGLI